ncbi:NUDIX hydrolase [Bacillus sp. OAE603]|uniref:NUDIX hydrolase n=1 Tax=Gottfriedia sp. OAE603 TaxID=2663872 RepID=UPI0017892E03
MNKWIGAAGICINESNQVLMVLQGASDEKKLWSVPSGGLEIGETLEECCIRELREETGYDIRIIKPLFIKEGSSFGVTVEVHFFKIEVIGGEAKIQDPDQLIHDIAWKSAEEVKKLELSFPEDLKLILDLLDENL